MTNTQESLTIQDQILNGLIGLGLTESDLTLVAEKGESVSFDYQLGAVNEATSFDGIFNVREIRVFSDGTAEFIF